MDSHAERAIGILAKEVVNDAVENGGVKDSYSWAIEQPLMFSRIDANNFEICARFLANKQKATPDRGIEFPQVYTHGSGKQCIKFAVDIKPFSSSEAPALTEGYIDGKPVDIGGAMGATIRKAKELDEHDYSHETLTPDFQVLDTNGASIGAEGLSTGNKVSFYRKTYFDQKVYEETQSIKLATKVRVYKIVKLADFDLRYCENTRGEINPYCPDTLKNRRVLLVQLDKKDINTMDEAGNRRGVFWKSDPVVYRLGKKVSLSSIRAGDIISLTYKGSNLDQLERIDITQPYQ